MLEGLGDACHRWVYEAQKLKTTKGDWIDLLKNDFKLIEEDFNEDKFKSMSKYKFKKFVKTKINKAALKYLEQLKNTHSKIKNIKYKKLQIQSYILSEGFTNEEVQTLFALRSRMIRVKKNFSKQFSPNLSCKLGCIDEEGQEHLLDCKHILSNLEDKSILAEIEYNDIFKDTKQQVEIAKIFTQILKIRKNLLNLNE